MARKIPALTQHVAMRVRVTRMFHKLSLEDAAALLNIPVWLLSYKENGLMNFTHQDFVELQRFYKISWLVFFQDYSEQTEFRDDFRAPGNAFHLSDEDYRHSDAIMNYLAAGEAEAFDATLSPTLLESGLSAKSDEERGLFASLRRWA